MTRPWLDSNNNHYAVRKLAHVARLKARIGWQNLRADEFVKDGPHCVTGTDFENGFVNWASSYRVTPERYALDANIQLENDDLLITKDGTIGKVAVVRNIPGLATLNSGVFLLRAQGEGFHSPYMKWVVQSKVFDDFVAYNSTGSTINHLYQNVFEQFRFPYPDHDTQKLIANFLDQETARINQLIEKKQRFVDLLEEKQAAQIAHFATKGLDPHANLHATGIDWIGAIPEHWTTRRLGTIFAFRNEKNDPVRTEQILSLSIAHGVTLYSEEEKTGGNKRKDDLSAYKLAFPGDIVLNSMNVIVGAVGRSKWLGAISPVYYALYPIDKSAYVPYFERVFLNSGFQRGLLRYGKGILIKISGTGKLNTIRMKISQTDLKALEMPIPPAEEQEAIANFLDQETERFDQLKSKTNLSVERLKECRSALITAAVTGQIDVTTWSKQGQTDRRLDKIEEELAAPRVTEQLEARP